LSEYIKENSNFYKNKILICLHTDVEASVVEDASFALVFSAFSTSLAIWAATCTKKIIFYLSVYPILNLDILSIDITLVYYFVN